MATDYYFISDLHLGGDGEMQQCDFAEEFIAFLKNLSAKGGDAELIIGGDLFGFWEITTVEGVAKFDEIVRHHQAIFDQFKETGSRVKITVMVGNHDYDLACHPEFQERLARYNLDLDTSISVRRQVLGKTIWVEHGQQSDPFNASPDYGNPYALPVGYFITRSVVGGASRYSSFGHGDWLKDIRSVATDSIPDWLLSNYFYREMAFAIRAVLTVFLLLLTVTVLAGAAELLRLVGLINFNILLDNRFISSLGYVGSIFQMIIFVNMLILAFMAVVALPGGFVLYDILRTLRRFHMAPGALVASGESANEGYLRRAHEVFAEHPETSVYLFGHTHRAFLSRAGDRVIVNMGTWLKLLERVSVRVGYLPGVYYPAFRLDYFHIRADGSDIVIRYAEIPKTPVRELSLLQRIVTVGRNPRERPVIPAETRIPGTNPDDPSF